MFRLLLATLVENIQGVIETAVRVELLSPGVGGRRLLLVEERLELPQLRHLLLGVQGGLAYARVAALVLAALLHWCHVRDAHEDLLLGLCASRIVRD